MWHNIITVCVNFIMAQDPNQKHQPDTEENKAHNPTHKQEQSDPQLTELRGLVDPKEDLEPTLQDGKKSPDKADETYEED